MSGLSLLEQLRADIDTTKEEVIANNERIRATLADGKERLVDVKNQVLAADALAVAACLSDESIRAYLKLAVRNRCPPTVRFIVTRDRAILTSYLASTRDVIDHVSKGGGEPFFEESHQFSPPFSSRHSVDAFYEPEGTARMWELEEAGIEVSAFDDQAAKLRWLTVNLSKVLQASGR